MSEGVPKIEQRARAARYTLAFVQPHDAGLDGTATFDGFGNELRLQRKNSIEVLLKPAKQDGVGDQAVLDDFCKTGADFPVRQGSERIGICDNGNRLMEGAQQVLAAGMVDRGLAANGGIDLCQQCCRQLHEIDAALINRGTESGEISDDAAAQSDQHAVTPQTCSQHPVQDIACLIPGFLRFTWLENERLLWL